VKVGGKIPILDWAFYGQELDVKGEEKQNEKTVPDPSKKPGPT